MTSSTSGSCIRITESRVSAAPASIQWTCLAEVSSQQNSTDFVEAWSNTNGTFGEMWSLSIQSDDSAVVTAVSQLGAKRREHRFTISTARREAILKAVEEAQFFALPALVGSDSIPVDGPENRLEIVRRGHRHRVVLNEPLSAKGRQVERFRHVWRAVVQPSPLTPPL
ncbi:hypothetical protein [Luteitalea sp.]